MAIYEFKKPQKKTITREILGKAKSEKFISRDC